MYRFILACFCLLFTACVSQTTKGPTTGSGSSDSMIQRIVCFRFRPGTSDQAIQQHLNGFAGLKDSIPYILSYRVGMTVPGDLSGKGEYDVMHYTTYRSEETIRQYAVHPVHQRFIDQNKAIWEKVLVINAKVEDR